MEAHAPSPPLMSLARIPTPLGSLVALASEEGLCHLAFADRRGVEEEIVARQKGLGATVVHQENDVVQRLATELEGYFESRVQAFSVPLTPDGTPFQRAAWNELLAIPYGVTRTYGEQARRMGRPQAVRAVARANGANPIVIVIPCHRVVGANGSLTGYGGGLWRKQRLLELEGDQLVL